MQRQKGYWLKFKAGRRRAADDMAAGCVFGENVKIDKTLPAGRLLLVLARATSCAKMLAARDEAAEMAGYWCEVKRILEQLICEKLLQEKGIKF